MKDFGPVSPTGCMTPDTMSFNRPAAVFLGLPVVPAVTILLKTHEIDGLLWCYPAIVLCYLVLSARVASACSLALLAFAGFTVNTHVNGETAVRLLVSFGLLLAIVAVILRLRADLQRLAEQAITDPLTGAFNRRHLNVCLAMAIERHRRTGEPASLLVFDIDRFKEINDAIGHPAGDYVLKALVGLIRGRARTLDSVFRTGGEEFALLLADANVADALAVGEDLRARVANAALLNGRNVSISVGVSELRDGQSVHAWIDASDEALYAAKRGGRNRVVGGPSGRTLAASAPAARKAFARG
jgi:diguanylate cyclase